MNISHIITKGLLPLYIIIGTLTVLPTESRAQNFDYEGKRWELDLALNGTGNIAYLREMSLGENLQQPGKRKYPLMPGIEVNYAFGTRLGIGLEYRRASCFVGHNVPIPDRDRPYIELDNSHWYYFKFSRNHTIKTNYVGMTARRYSEAHNGPASSYLEFGLGAVFVQHDQDDVYEYERAEEVLVYTGSYELFSDLVVTEVKSINRPKLVPIPLLKIGYTYRYEIEQVTGLFIDARIQISSNFGIGGSSGKFSEGTTNKEIVDEQDLVSLIQRFSQLYIQRQNGLILSFKIAYLL
jgi:hypothetical protein